MKSQLNKIYTCIAFSLFITVSFSQSKDRTYLAHDHNYGSLYSYDIREIIIHSDSTYTFKNYRVSGRKEWKNYKQYSPEVSNGSISKSGNYFILTEYRNGHKTDFFFTTKIKDKKLLFFYPNRRGILKRSAVYKRIDTN